VEEERSRLRRKKPYTADELQKKLTEYQTTVAMSTHYSYMAPNLFGRHLTEWNVCVPLPLHVLLGLANHFFKGLKDALALEGDKVLKDHQDKMLTFKAQSGAVNSAIKISQWNAYNGEEIRTILDANSRGNSGWAINEEVNKITNEERRTKIHDQLLTLVAVVGFLSQKKKFSPADIKSFGTVVAKHADDFFTSFAAREGTNETERKRTIPKAHMLFHCYEFAKLYKYLAPFGENAIEAHHHDIHLEFERHANVGKNEVKKVTRMAFNLSVKRSSEVREGREELPAKKAKRFCEICFLPNAKSRTGIHDCQCIRVDDRTTPRGSN
jgi:hypothetical protein